MSAELETLLVNSNASLEDVITVMEKGVDPYYKDSTVVARALELFGIDTLHYWMNEDNADDILRDGIRAWNIVRAAVFGVDDGSAFAEIYRMDSRENKEMSVAYLRAFRSAMVTNNTRCAETVLMTVGFSVGVFMDAVEIDFADVTRYAPVYEAERSAYVEAMSILSEDAPRETEAFIFLQTIMANSSEVIASNLMASDVEWGMVWQCVEDYDKHFDAIVHVMRAKISELTAPRTSYMILRPDNLIEHAILRSLYEYTFLFKSNANRQQAQQIVLAAAAKLSLSLDYIPEPTNREAFAILNSVYRDSRYDKEFLLHQMEKQMLDGDSCEYIRGYYIEMIDERYKYDDAAPETQFDDDV